MKYLILALLLVSCGSRKVNKSIIEQDKKTETTTKLVDTSKTTTKTTDNTKIIDSTSIDEIIIIPVDNTKSMTVNGKTYFNAILKHKKIKNNISIANDKKVSQIEQKGVNKNTKEKIIETNKSNTKIIEKKEVSPFKYLWWWLLIIAIVLTFIHIKNKYYASK
jgi:hypothetical protein